MNDRPVLPWLAGGLLLAAVLLFSVLTVKPLGVSTQYVRAAGGAAGIARPGVEEDNAYLRKTKITFGYSEMLVLGIPIGAALAALATRRWRRRAVPEVWAARFGASRGGRFAAAAAAGFLLLLGARLAGGCTSGHVLSGVSQLALSSILFTVSAFGVAVLTARTVYAEKEVHP